MTTPHAPLQLEFFDARGINQGRYVICSGSIAEAREAAGEAEANGWGWSILRHGEEIERREANG